ncbi:MAG: HEPN domain-containing protein [Candidatus Freyarchaeota archaeon]
MKGYLLSKGWQLERIHDLAVLLDEAVKYKPELEEFRDFLEEITVYYFQSRYPFKVEGPKGRSGKSTSPNKTNHPTPP